MRTVRPRARDLDVAQGPGFTQLLRGARIGGDDQARVMAQFAQGGGQAGGDIGQAAGLDQGMRLAAGQQEARWSVRALARRWQVRSIGGSLPRHGAAG